MNAHFTWIQISDIHWRSNPSRELVDYARHAVAEITDHLIPKYGAPQMVAITGDLAFSGQQQEYVSLDKHLLSPLRNAVGAAVPILMVPGNHDMDRITADDLNPRTILGLDSPAKLDNFLDDPGRLQSFSGPFEAYRRLVEASCPEGVGDGFNWTYDFSVEGHQVRVTGINSAWSCYYSQSVDLDEAGRLLIGTSQVSSHSSELFTGTKILMMHHPLDWLNENVCNAALTRIRNEHDILLSGHVHKVSELKVTTRPNSILCEVPSPLFCDQPHESDGPRLFSRGLVLASLDLESRHLDARYFVYNSDGPKFVPNVHLYARDEDKFTARLTRATDARRSHLDRPLDDGFHDAVQGTGSLAAESRSGVFATRFRRLAGANASQNHISFMFDRLLEFLTVRDFGFPSAPESATVPLAVFLTKLLISRGLTGSPNQAPEGAYADVLDEVRSVGQLVPAASDDELANIENLLPKMSIVDPTAVTDAARATAGPTTLMFLLLWGMAQMVSILDNPDVMPGGAASRAADRTNILDLNRSTESGRYRIKLGTKDRDEFLRIIEASHAVEQYLEEVEDLWRNKHCVAPSIRFDLNFPLWRFKAVQSHVFTVDAKPITKLLMGKTLYGDRRHPWLRELLQNAIDAIETRKLSGLDDDYRPEVEIKQTDSRTVIIRDNGIGMSYQNIISYLATLGRSGWRAYSAEKQEFSTGSFFGRFGIGFASVFSASQSLDVRTRPAGTRGVEGWAVRFKTPDRPFFIDPSACGEGTEIVIHLSNELAVSEFRSTLRDLFVYLPSYVLAPTGIDLPSCLQEVTGAGRVEFPKSAAVYEDWTGDIEFGVYSARLRIELIDLSHYDKLRKADHAMRYFTPTQLTVSIDGVHVFSREALNLRKAAVSAQAGNVSPLSGCYVTLDFDRSEAPILPSRNELEIDSVTAEQFSEALVQKICQLLPAVARRHVRAGKNPQTVRTSLLDWLAAAAPRPTRYHTSTKSELITEAAAAVYGEYCPVVVKSESEAERLVSLADAKALGCGLATTTALAEAGAFPAYVRAKALARWIEVRDERELKLLKDAWGFDPDFVILQQAHQLFSDINVFMTEVRTGNLVSVLRGDYALMQSPLFGASLYFYVPQSNSSASSDLGAGLRRSQTAGSIKPRVVVNCEHAIIKALESRLDGATDIEVSAITNWLESLCDGVIEDRKRKNLPRMRWERLRTSLQLITGGDWQAYGWEDLRLTV